RSIKRGLSLGDLRVDSLDLPKILCISKLQVILLERSIKVKEALTLLGRHVGNSLRFGHADTRECFRNTLTVRVEGVEKLLAYLSQLLCTLRDQRRNIGTRSGLFDPLGQRRHGTTDSQETVATCLAKG